MAKNKSSKHIKSFWPLFLLVIFAVILGSTIYAFAYGNMMQDDINSASFDAHHLIPQKTLKNTWSKNTSKNHYK